MVAFRACEAEEAILQDGIFFVPEGEAEAEALVVVAEPEQSVFGPAVGAVSGLIEWEIIPGGSVGGIVFADGSPATF